MKEGKLKNISLVLQKKEALIKSNLVLHQSYPKALKISEFL